MRCITHNGPQRRWHREEGGEWGSPFHRPPSRGAATLSLRRRARWGGGGLRCWVWAARRATGWGAGRPEDGREQRGGGMRGAAGLAGGEVDESGGAARGGGGGREGGRGAGGPGRGRGGGGGRRTLVLYDSESTVTTQYGSGLVSNLLVRRLR